jgi:serine/threonine protein kinase
VFDVQTVYSGKELLKIAESIASVCTHLHRKGINHGDLYAHNILVNKTAECLLGDFGAASFYAIHSTLAYNIERVEVSAFGCLIEDVFNLVPEKELNNELRNKWQQLISNCTIPEVKLRLSFSEIVAELNQFYSLSLS